MPTVLVLDDHDLVRRGIVDVLGAAPGITVIAEAATVRQSTARAALVAPDVAVLDYRLPDGTGAQACAALRAQHPDLPCLILTAFDDDDARAASAAAGAAGFLLKDIRAADLVDAVRRVASGHRMTATLRGHSDTGSASGADAATPARVDPAAVLPPRQREVFALVARGLSNREIADRLGVAEKTVKNHVTAILRTLALRRRTQIVVLAARTEATRRA